MSQIQGSCLLLPVSAAAPGSQGIDVVAVRWRKGRFDRETAVVDVNDEGQFQVRSFSSREVNPVRDIVSMRIVVWKRKNGGNSWVMWWSIAEAEVNPFGLWRLFLINFNSIKLIKTYNIIHNYNALYNGNGEKNPSNFNNNLSTKTYMIWFYEF